MTLPPALEAERLTLAGRAGGLSYYHAGFGAPVLLLHSINAAGSSFEMRPIFEHLKGRHSTYAVDLPGFGFSERSQRAYTIRLFTDAVHDMLDLIGDEHPGAQIDVLALSLSSEFAARAASETPERVRRLVLVTPTGFRRGSSGLRAAAQTPREVPGLHAVLSFGLWRDALYRVLTRESTIRYFLQRTYGTSEVDQDLVDYDYLTSHQPGAVHAPLAFLSGQLFSRDLRTIYESLELPIWVPHATRGDFKDFSDSGWAADRGNWTFTPFATGALPHFERPLEFMTALDAFMADAPGS